MRIESHVVRDKPAGTRSNPSVKLTPRRAVAALLLLIILAATAWVTLGFNNNRATVRRFKEQLSKNGEKLRVDDLLPPVVPPEQNGLSLFRQAYSSLTISGSGATLLDTNQPPAMRMVAPGRAMIGWKQAGLRELATNSWEDVGAELEENKDGLAMLAQAFDRPVLDFGLNYHQGFSMLLPHLASLKKTAQLLKSAAVYDLHQGKPDLAIGRIHTILALVKTHEEPLLISQLVRFADASIALDATWEVLHFPGLTDEQLAGLQRDWEQIDLLPGVEHAVAMERNILEAEADRMRNSSANYRSMMGLSRMTPATSGGTWFEQAGREFIAKAHESAWRYGWSYPDELRSLKGHQAVLEALRSVRAGKSYKDALAAEDLAVARAGIHQKTNDDNAFIIFGSFDPRTLLSQAVLSEQKVPIRLLRIEAGRQLVVTAVALERFKLAHGEYPESLSALAPAYLAALPLDPVDKQPLRYHRQPGPEFLLYSIGPDGIDDGGDSTPPRGTSSFPWLTAKDQVWPRPASEQDIEAFLKKNSRK